MNSHLSHLRIYPEHVLEIVEDRLFLSHPVASTNVQQELNIQHIKDIQVFGDAYLAPGIIQQLLHRKIYVSFFDRHGILIGRLAPKLIKKADLIRQQVLLGEDQKLQLLVAIVRACLKQRRILLMRYGREKNRNSNDLKKSVQKLGHLLGYFNPRFPKLHPSTIDSCRGYLGSGMQLYWGIFPQLLSAPFPWHGRNEDSPINLMIEFLYSLLRDTLWNALEISALDPWLGIASLPAHHLDFPPLAMDLCVEFQVYAEAMVLRAINLGQISVKDFDGSGGKLPAKVCIALAHVFDKKMGETFTHPVIKEQCSYLDAIHIQVQLYVDFLYGKRDQYIPLVLK